ncbi:ATP-dependent helicase HrpB [Dendrosporobacter sp. 1207_IL3150]|uniref:ATP-dependent helicase HrpB n=1 Tax=Dendrosporobacter sp. 1207_IL3150 TaxID=3084054 RepID=UPI002FDB42D2
MTHFPIINLLPQLKDTLNSYSKVVLVAPPGAGKTTQVPLALMNEPWLKGRKILVLEPRRIAARSAARYMASLIGEEVGSTVGYRVRLDTKAGPDTKIEIITEGILTRLLQDDAALENIGMVIFDEFHERSIHADLGLALCLQSQDLFREDLKLVIMSATLDVEPIAAMIGNCAVLKSEGRSYPVETFHLSSRLEGNIESIVLIKVNEALKNYEGDILVFLPGIREIRRVEQRLSQANLGCNVKVLPLYGSQTFDEQDAALKPSASGSRKVVLATSIAETSLTVEGVQVVIDSGLMRVSRFSPRTAMTRLETIRVSQAAAEQRRGRAGRQGPGICYRLWTKQEEAGFVQSNTPEIYDTDMTPLALELAAWGTVDPKELRWLDDPPLAAYNQGRELLYQLGALDKNGLITKHGRDMAALGCHPRLAHMLIKSAEIGLGQLACEIAAILGERDILRGQTYDADIGLRIEALRNNLSGYNQKQSIELSLYRRIGKEIKYWQMCLGISENNNKHDTGASGILLAFAYPDRIAQNRGNGRFLMRNGRGARLGSIQLLSEAAYIVVIELDDKGEEGYIHRAAQIDLENILNYFSDQLEVDITVKWDKASQSVRARRQICLGSICLKEEPVSNTNSVDVQKELVQGIKSEGLEILPWTKAARRFQERLIFLNNIDCTWPDISDEALLKEIDIWLGPHLIGISNKKDLQRINLNEIFESLLTWEQRQIMDRIAPSHVLVPSGQRIMVDYSIPTKPVLAVRLQELFGLSETPCVAGGKVPLTLHLLSPAFRPVQVTTDLASFWKHGYHEVKSDLKGRYPKHFWPDNPLLAAATSKAKPRK